MSHFLRNTYYIIGCTFLIIDWCIEINFEAYCYHICVCVCVRVCVNQSMYCEIWPNYEVVEFQPRSGIATVLESVAFIQLYYRLLPPHLFQPWTKQHTSNSKLWGWSRNHRIIPDEVLIFKTMTGDIKQNQFLTSLIKLGERFARKAQI